MKRANVWFFQRSQMLCAKGQIALFSLFKTSPCTGFRLRSKRPSSVQQQSEPQPSQPLHQAESSAGRCLGKAEVTDFYVHTTLSLKKACGWSVNNNSCAFQRCQLCMWLLSYEHLYWSLMTHNHSREHRNVQGAALLTLTRLTASIFPCSKG